ncbi:MAG: response regulator [Candidatus Eremiobacteraeota bacterium]|nr:response regulator [Candidatus Eremiobacteraeota bacterium]
MKKLRIIILEDLDLDAELMKIKLKREGLQFTSITVDSKENFQKALEEFSPDIILVDYKLPNYNGMEAMQFSLERYPDLPVIIVTGSINEETAVNCMKEGATDYVLKDSLSRLAYAVEGAIKKKRIEEEKRRAEEELRNLNVELEKRVEERTTELMKVQKELLNNERLAVIGKLAASLSNELENPLTAMRKSINYLKEKYQGVDAESQKHLDTMEEAIMKASNLTYKLLEYVHAPEANPSGIGGMEIIEDVLSRIRIPENIKLYIPKKEDTPYFYADKEQVGHIVQNLLLNAIQSMPSSGELVIKSGVIGERGYLEITDTGTGIKREEIEQIFEPLYTTKLSGIGLGLSICKRYADINDGEIRVNSKPDEGSTFRLLLPLSELE